MEKFKLGAIFSSRFEMAIVKWKAMEQKNGTLFFVTMALVNLYKLHQMVLIFGKLSACNNEVG
ncbi:hypothetical protein QQP08_010314 [Theobroma cacao]|nr:hypothetical protein QQP08_010314 [Theobroma cacao]